MNDQQTTADTSRRLRIYYLPESELLTILGEWRNCRVVGIPEDSLPADAKLVSVHHAYMSRAFALTIQHESFEPVRDGDLIPTHDRFPYRFVELPTADQPVATDCE